MPSLLMRYNPEATDVGITARDQSISLSRREGLAVALSPLGSMKNRFSKHITADTTENLLMGLQVDDSAPELVIWDRFAEWDQSSRKRTLFISETTYGNLTELASLCDDVIVIPGIDIITNAQKAIPSVVIEPDESSPLIPDSGNIAYVHVQGERDKIGFYSLIEAWFRTDEMRDNTLIISTDGYQDDLILPIKMARKDAAEHTVMIVNDDRASLIDSLVLSSDLVICCHTMTTVGWRPVAMKAALAGKSLMSVRCGSITKHVTNCNWVDMPPMNMDGIIPSTITGSEQEKPLISVEEYREFHEMLTLSFRESLCRWADGYNEPVRSAVWSDPNLVELISGRG